MWWYTRTLQLWTQFAASIVARNDSVSFSTFHLCKNVIFFRLISRYKLKIVHHQNIFIDYVYVGECDSVRVSESIARIQ